MALLRNMPVLPLSPLRVSRLTLHCAQNVSPSLAGISHYSVDVDAMALTISPADTPV